MDTKIRIAGPARKQRPSFSHTDEWASPKNAAMSMKQLLASPEPPRSFMLTGLIASGETTCVQVGPSLNSMVYSLLIAHACATGTEFQPHRTASAAEVLFLFGSEHPAAYHKTVRLIAELDREADCHHGESLKFLFPPRRTRSSFDLSSTLDQRTLLDSTKGTVGLVVVSDASAWVDPKATQDPIDSSSIGTFASKLNEQGIAVLLFFPSNRKTAHLDFGTFRTPPNVIQLKPDPMAPTEFGGGFLVCRNRFDEDDHVPMTYRFWHLTRDGKLEFGWSLVDQTTPMAGKQIAMKLRQLKVEQLMATGLQQKAIAEAIGVDAATISRDVAKIKKSSPHRDGVEEKPEDYCGIEEADTSCTATRVCGCSSLL